MKKYIFCCFALGAFFSEGYAAGDPSLVHKKFLTEEEEKLLHDALGTEHFPGEGVGIGSLAEDYDFEEIPDLTKQQKILDMIRWEGMLSQHMDKAEKEAAKRESSMGSIRQRVEGIWRSCNIYAIPTNAEIDKVFKDKNDRYRQRIKNTCNKLRDLWARTEKLPG